MTSEGLCKCQALLRATVLAKCGVSGVEQWHLGAAPPASAPVPWAALDSGNGRPPFPVALNPERQWHLFTHLSFLCFVTDQTLYM